MDESRKADHEAILLAIREVCARYLPHSLVRRQEFQQELATHLVVSGIGIRPKTGRHRKKPPSS